MSNLRRPVASPFLLLSLACAAFCGGAPGQESAPPRTLLQLRQGFAARMDAARKSDGAREAQLKVLAEQARELESFLEHEAKGDDVFNGRLMLVDTFLALGQADAAKTALAGFKPDKTPALALVAAAQLAQMLGEDDQRRRFVDAAIAKPAPFEERMALGMHLLTVLREVDKGDRIFADAFAAAKDDEQRARVRWYQVAALREREDRADDAYYKALDALAKEFPDTEFGSIARDRIAAAEHAPGKPPVPLHLVTTKGEKLSLRDLEGKVVILDFWASWSDAAPSIERFLQGLQEKYGDQGLRIVGISMDDVRAEYEAFVDRTKPSWPQVFDGRGVMTAPALRYNIEAPPSVMVIDRTGRIVAHNLLPIGEEEQSRVEGMVKEALAR
ncbi:MAG: TlpA disulfide reductase family protein [Planctomycetota bacterium]